MKRNVALLWKIPRGREGRPSTSLTLDQAEAVFKASEGTALHAYIVLSLLLGAHTEELRALTWSHVDLDGTLPSIMVWHSVQEGGNTKTRKSRRTPAMPKRCVDALKLHREQQDVARKAAGASWQDNGLVFASKVGTELDSHNVRRSFRAVLKKAGLNEKEWTPREMRHSFVSLLSDSGIPLENISRLVGHRNTSVTETVYRKQLRPVLLDGAEAMDRIFPD
ncbi:site-specific integrase [Streptosporangium vulgare]|uniref:Tyrosine recombinase XerC n=1 Tax=Streptosporangium vulgare TaxID=46190 RepID=A0ABV5THX2_9ACTN